MKKVFKTAIAAFLTAAISIGLFSSTASAAGKNSKKTSNNSADVIDEPATDEEDERPNLTYDEWKATLTIPEETLTIERFKEFLSSDDAKLSGFLMFKRYLLDPLSSGAVTFSKPFRIPIYRKDANSKFEPIVYTWYTAIFQNERLCALMKMGNVTGKVFAQTIEFVPYDIAERINSGEELSLYIVYAEVDGEHMTDYDVLYYNIDESGKSTLVNKELNFDYELSNPDPLKTTKADYNLISSYNVLSKNMKKVATYKNRYSTDLRDGGEIIIMNRSEKYQDKKTGDIRFKSRKSYIAHEAGKDENGEMTYTFSSISNPDKTIKLAGYEKFYLRMSSGTDEPQYRICPVPDTNKALTLTNGKIKAKKWTGASEQLWYIQIMS